MFISIYLHSRKLTKYKKKWVRLVLLQIWTVPSYFSHVFSDHVSCHVRGQKILDDTVPLFDLQLLFVIIVQTISDCDCRWSMVVDQGSQFALPSVLHSQDPKPTCSTVLQMFFCFDLFCMYMMTSNTGRL